MQRQVFILPREKILDAEVRFAEILITVLTSFFWSLPSLTICIVSFAIFYTLVQSIWASYQEDRSEKLVKLKLC